MSGVKPSAEGPSAAGSSASSSSAALHVSRADDSEDCSDSSDSDSSDGDDEVKPVPEKPAMKSVPELAPALQTESEAAGTVASAQAPPLLTGGPVVDGTKVS